MKIGAVFPQTEIGSDPGGVRDYAQAVEEMGYSHILVYDHVVGASPEGRGPMPYTDQSLFHEPMVLFGYLAGLTKKVELVTGVIILPQRQTVLAAKQAAEVDILTGGRFRLGVGIGWNEVEYEALGMSFRNRGRRFEEQIELMRRLWEERSVTYEGHWHKVSAAGLNPLPLQNPLPLWIGATSDVAIRRACRLADGFFPQR